MTKEMSTIANEDGASLAEILSALSHALDLTEGQRRGHALRTALMARRIAREMGLGEQNESRAFYAALLKDSGCSTNSARIQKAFGGDERVSKYDVKFVDWSQFFHSAWFALSHAERGGTPGQRLRKALELARTPPRLMDEVTEARCIRGAEIATRLGFDAETAAAIRTLDEHWDGRGSPAKLRGENIPLLARVIGAAQTFELFATEIGQPEAYEMLRKRNGRWFDPQVVQALESLSGNVAFWFEQAQYRADDPPPVSTPDDAVAATEADVDQVCLAFAQIVDAKSSFTAEHSNRVTAYAVALGIRMELPSSDLRTLHRAAMLHDVGKLGVSNAILDKPGRLNAEEWECVKRHPRYSFEILSRIRGFSRVANLAATHHERLDGRGYFQGYTEDRLDLPMRILAVADVYDALAADRPYRPGMDAEEVLRILRSDADAGALDPQCVEAAHGLTRVTPAAAGYLG